MRNGLESSAIIYHACGHTIIVVPSTSTALSSKLSERQSPYIRTTHQPNTHRSVDLCICPVETGPGPWRWSLSASPRAVSRRLVCPRPGLAARIVSRHSPELKLNFSATLRIPSAWEVAVVYCMYCSPEAVFKRAQSHISLPNFCDRCRHGKMVTWT